MEITKYIVTFFAAPLGLFWSEEYVLAFISTAGFGLWFYMLTDPMFGHILSQWSVKFWLMWGVIGCVRMFLKDNGVVS